MKKDNCEKSSFPIVTVQPFSVLYNVKLHYAQKHFNPVMATILTQVLFKGGEKSSAGV